MIVDALSQVAPNLAETLYRYRTDLEIIFNIIDKDHSGKFDCLLPTSWSAVLETNSKPKFQGLYTSAVTTVETTLPENSALKP